MVRTGWARLSTHSEILSKLPNVQWRLDNIDAIAAFLDKYEARVARDGDRLLVQAYGGLDTHLDPGDCLILEGDKLGILRVPDGASN